MANLIPVLDVRNSIVVQAIGGRRSEYRPIRSVLTDSCEPREVALAMIAATKANTIYVADLDGIMTGTPSRALRSTLKQLPVRLLLDSGIRTAADVADDDRLTMVLGTETLEGPHVLEQLGETKAVLSVDLFEGQLLGNWRAWGVASDRDVIGLLASAEAIGLREVILLDIARVGGGRGTGTEAILREAVRRFPGMIFYAGGGVSGQEDATRLTDAGAVGLLVSSVIHEGSLRCEYGLI